jgi:HAD superfamily hydrolase (TIGR01509 family)
MISGVIFDLDGVLADTNSMWVQLYRDISHKVGISGELSYEKITKNFGEKYEIVLEELIGRENMTVGLSLLENRIHSKSWINDLKPVPAAIPVLGELKKRRIRMAVVSGNNKDVLLSCLRILGMTAYFQTTVAADEVTRAKPDPEAILKAISILNLQKSGVIYIGDAGNDVKAARAAGIRVATVLTGALDRKKAESLKPDWILNDVGELLTIL